MTKKNKNKNKKQKNVFSLKKKKFFIWLEPEKKIFFNRKFKMTKSDKELPPIIHRSDNDDASSTSYTFPNSPSLQNEEGFRYRSTTTTTSPKKFWDSQPIPSSPTTTTITTNSTIIIENENIKLPYLDR